VPDQVEVTEIDGTLPRGSAAAEPGRSDTKPEARPSGESSG